MAAVVADFVAREGASVSDVFVLLAVTMLTTSLVTGVIGRFGLGGVTRYLPTPVIAAFAGGTGWLMFKGGVDVMTTSSLERADLDSLLGFGMAKFWLPGLVVGVVTWLVGRSQRLPAYTLGLIFIACLGGCYGVVMLTSSVSTVEAEGWLLGPFPQAGGPTNAELRTGAGANLAVALLGVTPGSQGYGFTMMLHRLGATGRAVPLALGVLVVAFGVAGPGVVGYVPRFIVGALLVMLGVALLDEWIQGLRRITSVAERLLSVATVGAVIPLGLVVVRLFQELRRKEIVVRVSALDPEIVASLVTIEPELPTYVRFVPSLAAALKHAEDQLLTSLPGRPLLIGAFGVVPAPEHRRWREPAESSPTVRSSCDVRGRCPCRWGLG